ncbi:MAG: DUF1963 domain-containing protein [Paracoccaceae bacterium]
MGFTDYLTVAIILVGVLFWGIWWIGGKVGYSPKGKENAQTTGTSAKQNLSSGTRAAQEYLARSGTESRAKQLPAWGLQVRSPYKHHACAATSWIGGTPKAPADFDWPRGASGNHMFFLATIDLASLSPDAVSGLPSEGALLIFFGDNLNDKGRNDASYSCIVLSAIEMQTAVRHETPHDPIELSTHLYLDSPVFPKWPVDLIPFLDDGNVPPAKFPDIFKAPERWISNWGVAAMEAKAALYELEAAKDGLSNQHAKKRLDDARRTNAQYPGKGYGDDIINQAEALAADGDTIITALQTWKKLAESKPAGEPVDAVALRKIFEIRSAFADHLYDILFQTMRYGASRPVWENICAEHPAFERGAKFETIADTYRDFVEMWAMRWVGHRLFGLEPEFPNNDEDLRGHDCLISVGFDDVFGNRTEHFYGMSIWCPREEMSKGQLQNGQLVFHCAV